MTERLTRKDFLKVAGTGTAGLALLGASAATSGCSYLPEGGSKVNVVVVIVDSLRRDHVGAYGNDWIKTPNLDALAGESLRFTKAHPDAMPTLPARRAIHTGMRTYPVKPPTYGWRSIPEGQATLAEILKAKGYSTFLVTDTYHQWKPSMNFGRGFDVFRKIRGQQGDPYKDPSVISEEEMRQRYLVLGKGTNLRQHLANTRGRKSEEDWFAPKVFINAMDALEKARRSEPFFLVVDCYDPHEPWDPPEEYVTMYDDEPYDLKEPFSVIYGPSNYLLPRELERMKARYSGELTMMDRWLGRFLDKMEELNLFENTLLILLADHGVAHGEHSFTGKPDNVLWPEVTDIPFFIRHPGGKGAGQTSDYYASTHDVTPTIVNFLGIEPQQPLDGQDLSAALDGGELEPRNYFTLGYNDHVWARDERYVMFSLNDGSDAKLYDIQADPEQRGDIAADEPNIVKRMFEGYVLRDAGGPLPTYDYNR